MTEYLKCAEYLECALDPRLRRAVIEVSLRRLRKLKKITKFNTLAVRGISGLAVGSILSHQLKCNLTVVRSTKACHSIRDAEGYIKGDGKYIIVDDFVCSGRTIKKIIAAIGDDMDCVGILLYNSSVVDIDEEMVNAVKSKRTVHVESFHVHSYGERRGQVRSKASFVLQPRG
jgi:orotate phosphoribosyltransferase-like protein